jgi:hypothetical protein
MHACPWLLRDPTRECRCTPAIIRLFSANWGRSAGHCWIGSITQIEVPAVPYKELRAGEGCRIVDGYVGAGGAGAGDSDCARADEFADADAADPETVRARRYGRADAGK